MVSLLTIQPGLGLSEMFGVGETNNNNDKMVIFSTFPRGIPFRILIPQTKFFILYGVSANYPASR